MQRAYLIVVSGLPRSGTSAMMAALRAGGIPLSIDGVRRPDEFNPRGYYEHEEVRTLDKPLSEALSLPGTAIKVLTHKLRYLRPQPPARVVFMHRELQRVVKSQESMAPADQPDVDWIDLWEKELARAREALRKRRNTEVLEVEFSNLLGSPRTTLGEVADFLDCGLDIDAMAQTIEPNLSKQFKGNPSP
jgi:hypothetical protein